VIRDIAAIPIRAPTVIAPAVTAIGPAHRHSSAECKCACGDWRPPGITRVRAYRRSIDFRTVAWDVHHFWVRRLNDDRLALRTNSLFRSALEITSALRISTQCLDGTHHAFRSIEVRVA